MPDIMVCAQKLQLQACEMVESDFGDIRGDPAELRRSGHIFSRHFHVSPRSGSQWGGATALQALASAAHQRNEQEGQSQVGSRSAMHSTGQAVLSASVPANPVETGLGIGGDLDTVEWREWIQAFDDFERAV